MLRPPLPLLRTALRPSPLPRLSLLPTPHSTNRRTVANNAVAPQFGFQNPTQLDFSSDSREEAQSGGPGGEPAGSGGQGPQGNKGGGGGGGGWRAALESALATGAGSSSLSFFSRSTREFDCRFSFLPALLHLPFDGQVSPSSPVPVSVITTGVRPSSPVPSTS